MWKWVSSIALFFLLIPAVFAQSDNGSIAGFAKDPSGAVIPKAKVTVRSEGTGETHVVATNESGYYTVTNIAPNFYTVTVEASGFKKFTSTHNRLDPNTALSLDAALAVGAASETVEVSASATVLQTESAAVQDEVTGKQIDMQELNGRDPLYIAQLIPGMRSSGTLGDFNFGVAPGNPFSVNGARTQDTSITIDSAPAMRTRANGAVIGAPNVDATEEIQVLTADYQAEYGRAAGGQIRLVSKSGTTDFHGGLYEYIRNSAMNANTWTRNQSIVTDFTQPLRYNNFGGTIGGPVWVKGMPEKYRQKFFFFVAEDWIRYRLGDYSTESDPTPAMVQGNFSAFLSPNPWYKTGTLIYDPTTCSKAGSSSCVPFPGNIIPTASLSHNGTAILSAYPTPTPGFQIGATNWIGTAPHPINQRKGTLDFDIIVNPANKITARRTDVSYFEYQPFDQGSGLTGKYFKRPNQTTTLSLISTITPTLINEARLTLSIDDVYIPVNASLAGFNRQDFGIDYPYLMPYGKDYPNKIPTVSLPGGFYGLAGGPYPSHSSGTIWTYGDTITKVAGNHTIKAGFLIEYSGENDGDQINVATVPGGASDQNGTFQFSDTRTGYGATSGVGIANLALGLADSYTEIGKRALTIWRAYMSEAFVQDSWKVTSKLHVDYGIRWSMIQGFHPLWGNADYFDGKVYNPANAVTVNSAGNVELGTGNPYNGVVIPGISSFPQAAIGRVLAATPGQNTVCDGATCGGLFDPSIHQSYINNSNTWQPRVGLAYQISEKTVLRAGIGEFVTRMGLLDNVFPGGNSPFQPFVTVTNVSVDNPGAALTSTTAAPLTITTLNPNLKPPTAWNYNVTVQRQLFLHSVLTAAYVGHHGDHGWQVYDINQPQAGTVVSGVNVNQARPYKGFAAIQEEESVVNSEYNSFQVAWERRFFNNSSFGFTYTLSKSMDNGSNYRDIVADTRHMVIINYIYGIPFFKNNRWAGGWSLAGTAQFQTGAPCGIGANNDYAGVGEVGSLGCGSEGEFWNLNGPVTIHTGAFAGPAANSNSVHYFTANVTQPTADSFVLQPGVRDSVYQPGFQDWNLSLFKTFKINERYGFQFRAECYDLPNHPNLSGPNLTATSSLLGEITSKTTLFRALQLSLRFYF
jgi:hypothetical protein